MFENIIDKLENEKKTFKKRSEKLKKIDVSNKTKNVKLTSNTVIKNDLLFDKKVKIISDIPEKKEKSSQVLVSDKKSEIVELW